MEVLEGTTYQSAVDHVMDEPDIVPIPEPLVPPRHEVIESSPRNLVCFDLETTGGGYEDEILQIAARDWKTGDTFSVYTKPCRKSIPRRISNLTGIELHGGVMYQNLQEVSSCNISDALSSFDTWLQRHETTFLVAHNAGFDSRMLINSSIRSGQNVCTTVLAFVDTLPIFRRAFPGMMDYKLSTLVREHLKRSYDAHNADADTAVLTALCEMIPHEFVNIEEIATSIEVVKYKVLKAKNEKAYLDSFSDIVSEKLMTKVDARLIAGSGLSLTDIRKIFHRSGQDFLTKILKEVGLKRPLATVNTLLEKLTIGVEST